MGQHEQSAPIKAHRAPAHWDPEGGLLGSRVRNKACMECVSSRPCPFTPLCSCMEAVMTDSDWLWRALPLWSRQVCLPLWSVMGGMRTPLGTAWDIGAPWVLASSRLLYSGSERLWQNLPCCRDRKRSGWLDSNTGL